ncbi:MAG: nucleoside triphosphate pyrophosphohydrolase [Anaerolineales bacterium]|jgi:tetrapyrrole methylase family protein/MazG family protein
MVTNGITILGLGPGNPHLLTRQAWQVLNTISEIYLRTRKHPVVDGFPTGLVLHSFDNFYEDSDTFEAVYDQIVERVLELGKRPEGVVYAVPGHPFVAEATCPQIYRRARELDIPIKVLEGISFLEPTLTALGEDILPYTALADALELTDAHVPPFPPSAPAIIAQIYSRDIASDVKLTLMALYPDEHPVKLVHAAGTEHEMVEALPLYAVDRSRSIGLLTSLYVPPMERETSFEAFQEVIAHLRAPDGCPWDREQTHKTLRSHLLEEAYEVIAAIDADESQAMREEFGDLLLQIVLHSQIASEYGEFTMSDILKSINSKIVSRHPHVFGDLELQDMDKVLLNWERLKEAERQANGKAGESLLDGVARALPALVQAGEYQRRAARVGFDWPEIQGVIDKVNEEWTEVGAASDQEERLHEIGDLFFAVVNLARWYDVDAESALREANTRFRDRFAVIEQAARSQGRSISDLALDEMEALWQSSKPDQ